MSRAFSRVLLLNVLLGLRIQSVLAAESGKHLRALCIQLWSSIIYTSCAGQHPSESKRPKMPSCWENQQASSHANEKFVKGCQPPSAATVWSKYLLVYSTNKSSSSSGNNEQKSHMQRSLTHGSAGHADE